MSQVDQAAVERIQELEKEVAERDDKIAFLEYTLDMVRRSELARRSGAAAIPVT